MPLKTATPNLKKQLPVKKENDKQEIDKKELIKELTETVCRVLEADPQAVRVELVEVPPENWGIAGVPMSERDS